MYYNIHYTTDVGNSPLLQFMGTASFTARKTSHLVSVHVHMYMYYGCLCIACMNIYGGVGWLGG